MGVAPSGAALANLVFSPSSAAFVFLPLVPWNEHYHHLAAVLASAGLLQGGFHIVASLSSSYAGSYHVTQTGCTDLLSVVGELLRLEADFTPCIMLSPRVSPLVCGT